MAKLTINVGTNQDDGTGDLLRAAFVKVNDNFTELYNEMGGTSLSNLKFAGNTISTDNTNANLILNPNGTGQVQIEGHVRLALQSGDPTANTSSGYIYTKTATNAEVHVMDGLGNVTKISPHNNSGEWEYFSRNINTGKVVRINMERMIRKLEEITGEQFIEEE